MKNLIYKNENQAKKKLSINIKFYIKSLLFFFFFYFLKVLLFSAVIELVAAMSLSGTRNKMLNWWKCYHVSGSWAKRNQMELDKKILIIFLLSKFLNHKKQTS